MSGLEETLAVQMLQRHAAPSRPRIKVNLYRGYEVRAVAKAFVDVSTELGACGPDCLMVGDSYLTTHMGRTTTRLTSIEEQDEILMILRQLVAEVKAEMSAFAAQPPPYLIADLPDGAATTRGRALRSAETMLDAGADAIKLEVDSPYSVELIDYLAHQGIPVTGHIGYTPQRGENRSFGASQEEACRLFGLARAIRDAGARILVLERVCETVNGLLCARQPGALPVYSIFSGTCPAAGQSLNVWDSVFVPPFSNRLFPPSARFRRQEYPDCYTVARIQEHFAEILRLTLMGKFPSHGPRRMPQQEARSLDRLNPWIEPVGA